MTKSYFLFKIICFAMSWQMFVASQEKCSRFTTRDVWLFDIFGMTTGDNVIISFGLWHHVLGNSTWSQLKVICHKKHHTASSIPSNDDICDVIEAFSVSQRLIYKFHQSMIEFVHQKNNILICLHVLHVGMFNSCVVGLVHILFYFHCFPNIFHLMLSMFHSQRC